MQRHKNRKGGKGSSALPSGSFRREPSRHSTEVLRGKTKGRHKQFQKTQRYGSLDRKPNETGPVRTREEDGRRTLVSTRDEVGREGGRSRSTSGSRAAVPKCGGKHVQTRPVWVASLRPSGMPFKAWTIYQRSRPSAAPMKSYPPRDGPLSVNRGSAPPPCPSGGFIGNFAGYYRPDGRQPLLFSSYPQKGATSSTSLRPRTSTGVPVRPYMGTGGKRATETVGC